MKKVNNLSLICLPSIPIEELIQLDCETIKLYWKENSAINAVRSLISNWKGNKTRLEHLEILASEDWNFDLVLEGMNAKPWNPRRRPSNYQKEDLNIDCTSYMDIEGDCQIASIGIRENRYLDFIVWF